MPYCPICATLGYVLSPDRERVLLIHRNARPEDDALGKYNGLGGKMEPSEDIATCMKRELMEEAGLTVQAVELRGTVSWPGFGKNGEDWLGFLFLITDWSGEIPSSNAEGSLEWHPVRDLLEGKLPTWEGDRYFLPLVFDGDSRPFHGVMPYSGGKPLSWAFSR